MKKNDKVDFIKIKNSYSAKDNVKRIEEKTRHRFGENIHKNTSGKGLLSKIYKELLKLNNKKANSSSRDTPVMESLLCTSNPHDRSITKTRKLKSTCSAPCLNYSKVRKERCGQYGRVEKP